MIIEEIKNIKSTNKELREFGIVVGIAFSLLGGMLWWKGRDNFAIFFIISTALIILGLVCPAVLKPIQKIWMTFAIIIGFVMTRVILFVLFFVIITPIGVLSRLTGKDSLELNFSKKKESYWVRREKTLFSKENYEKQF